MEKAVSPVEALSADLWWTLSPIFFLLLCASPSRSAMRVLGSLLKYKYLQESAQIINIELMSQHTHVSKNKYILETPRAPFQPCSLQG